MARKTRKRTASKATNKAKTSSKKGTMPKTRRIAVAPKKRSKSAVRKVRARKPIPKASESLSQRVAAAFHTIVDTLSDAEQLHRKLDPGVSREPE